MRNAKTKWLIFFFTSLFLSCTIVGNDHPDISNLEDTGCRASGNDIFASVKIITLETNDSCLLSNPSLVDFCDDGIFVWNRNIVYKFDSNGHFANRIGKIGHGYGEYTGVNSINYDKKQRIVYIGTFGNDIYKYDINGNYLGKFHVFDGKDMLLTSRWSETLGLYVCETRDYRSDGLDVKLTVWTPDGKKKASYTVYSDNEVVNHNFIRTGSLEDIVGGVLFRMPFCDTIYMLSKSGMSEYMVIDRGKHTPTRSLVEDNGNESKLEKESYYINHWSVTRNYIYMTISCHRGYRDVIVRLPDNKIIHNQFYSYKEDDGTHQLHLKELGGTATFWPWIANGDKVAGLVENRDKAQNPILVIATEAHAPTDK